MVAVAAPALDAVDGGSLGPQTQELVDVEVGDMSVHRERDVAWIPADADVRHPAIERQTIQGRVRLEEPAVALCGEIGEDLRPGPGDHVDPRRDHPQRSREVGILEDEERADHLRPGRAGLRRSRDDDVARSELQALPAGTVPEHPAVADPVHRPSLSRLTGRARRRRSGDRDSNLGTAGLHREAPRLDRSCWPPSMS